MSELFSQSQSLGERNMETGLKYQFGWATDIGGGRTNQDNAFIYTNKKEKIFVIGVLDGHGIEFGKLASTSARQKIIEHIEKNHEILKTDPYKFLSEVFGLAHQYIKETMKIELEKQGYEVQETLECYLLKRRSKNQPWQHIPGGSTCSIIAIVDYKMYSANVGDSTGLMCSPTAILEKHHIVHIGDAARDDIPALVSVNEPKIPPTTSIVITAEHSPENVNEFYRFREFRSQHGVPTKPLAKFVYDKEPNKEKRPFIYDVDEMGVAKITNKGSFYKNVRQEYATLITTPHASLYPTALAMTRSLGDFYLNTYGVSEHPDIHLIDLEPMMDKLHEQFLKSEKSLHEENFSIQPMLCIVLASDGLWDNWIYEDVNEFVNHSSCVNAVCKDANGCQDVAQSLIHRNAVYAKQNFGNQRDNATAIVVYLSDYELFPYLTDDYNTKKCQVL